MIKHLFYRLLCAFLPLFGLFTLVYGDYNSSMFYTSLSQVFSPLADLDQPGSQRIGGLNLTRCCLLAVKESYQIDSNGHVIQSPNPTNFLQISAAELANKQFPCGASYNGDDDGAPKVTIPNSWCQSNCGGWQKSSNKALTQWIQPFVGFILPAAVFCLNVRHPTWSVKSRAKKSRFREGNHSLSQIVISLITSRNYTKNMSCF